MVKGFALADVAAAAVVTHVNTASFERAEPRFGTLFYGRLSPNGLLEYCNAGHNPPFLVRGSSMTRLEVGGLVVGLFQQASYESATIQLEPGEMLLLFTDGVSEALNVSGEEFGDDRIAEVIRRGPIDATSAVDGLLASVREFSMGTTQHDDLTVAVVKYSGLGIQT